MINIISINMRHWPSFIGHDYIKLCIKQNFTVHTNLLLIKPVSENMLFLFGNLTLMFSFFNFILLQYQTNPLQVTVNLKNPVFRTFKVRLTLDNISHRVEQ